MRDLSLIGEMFISVPFIFIVPFPIVVGIFLEINIIEKILRIIPLGLEVGLLFSPDFTTTTIFPATVPALL
jgi:hypothetical protein